MNKIVTSDHPLFLRFCSMFQITEEQKSHYRELFDDTYNYVMGVIPVPRALTPKTNGKEETK